MKTNSEVSLKETVERFQEVLRGNPPPWLQEGDEQGRSNIISGRLSCQLTH